MSDKKKLFRSPFEYSDYGDIALIDGENRHRMLRKLSKYLTDEIVLINHLQQEEKVLRNRKNEYKTFSYKTVFPVMDKICRQVAEKYAVTLPFRNVYIIGNTNIAYEIILSIPGFARMFSVVTDEALGKTAEELYFEYGCIIRHIRKLSGELRDEDMIICLERALVPEICTSPVITFDADAGTGKKHLCLSDICAFDERISHLAEFWGGRTGLLTYELLNILPDKNTQIDINKKADRIFLLDTGKI